MWDDLDKESD